MNVQARPRFRTSLAAVAAGLAIMLFGASDASAKRVKPPDFPVAAFQANEAVARWLVSYDWAAWNSSDIVMAQPEDVLKRLGTEWFCVETKRDWDCLYGRYDAKLDRYEVVLHLRAEAGGAFVRTDAAFPGEQATAYGRAIARSMQALPREFRDVPFKFNTYVRTVDDGKVEVWWLPAGQSDGTLVYGGDLRHTLDPAGNAVLDSQLTYTAFRAGKPDAQTELQIDNTSRDVPTVGQIFFLLAFRDQFKSIAVVSRSYLTQMITVEGKQTAWFHIDRKDAKKRR